MICSESFIKGDWKKLKLTEVIFPYYRSLSQGENKEEKTMNLWDLLQPIFKNSANMITKDYEYISIWLDIISARNWDAHIKKVLKS